MDYKGGTYVAQKQAASVKGALKKWAKELDCALVYGLSDKGQIQLAKEIAEENPTALKGVNNVWCTTASLPRGLALINAIRTYED